MRAIIIERWAILRHGLRAVLSQAGYPVLSAASSTAEGLAAIRSARQVDVVVCGCTDDRAVLDSVAAISALDPDVKLLVLVDSPDPELINDLLHAGVAGIFHRLAEGEEILDAMARLERGERVLSNEVINALVGALHANQPVDLRVEGPTGSELTTREQEVLSWLATGATNRAIARELVIGEATVKSHLASAYAKLGVANRHQAVARGIELGIVDWVGARSAGPRTGGLARP